MKRLSLILLGLSLSANALCVAALWRADRAVTKREKSKPPLRAPAKPPFDTQTWTQFRDDDLREYAARLRQAGFPADIVRAIIVAQLNESNEPRRRALQGTPDAVNYWRQSRRSPAE